MRRVAVVGVGLSPFAAERRADTFADLAYEATVAALADAGLGIADVGNVVTASNDFLDGRTISSMAVTDAVGAAFGEGKNVSTVEGDGAFAAFYGMARILSGAYPTTLVVAHSKASEGDRRLLSNACFDPVFERGLGLDWVTAAALEARVCLDRAPGAEVEWAAAVARNRAAGADNPRAQLRSPVTAEEVLDSEPLAEPIKALDAAPLSDGAAAVLLADEDFARWRCARPVWVEGAAYLADGRLTERPLGEARALAEAGRRCFRQAGIDRPARELVAAELSCQFSYQEPLYRGALGLSSLPDGRVSPSGGLFCANAEVAAGLARIIEAALRLRQEPGKALAHGQHGPAGQSHCVWVLGSRG